MPCVIDDPDLLLSDLFRHWPETACVFMSRGMLCPGCAFTPYHTIADACQEYGFDTGALVAALDDLVRAGS